MNTLNIANCSVVELNHNDMVFIEGGGLLDRFLDGVTEMGKAVGHVVGYAAGVVYDTVVGHGEDVAAAGGAAASLAYK